MKNVYRKTGERDPCLSPGWSYFVETNAYAKHIAKFASQSHPAETDEEFASRYEHLKTSETMTDAELAVLVPRPAETAEEYVARKSVLAKVRYFGINVWLSLLMTLNYIETI